MNIRVLQNQINDLKGVKYKDRSIKGFIGYYNTVTGSNFDLLDEECIAKAEIVYERFRTEKDPDNLFQFLFAWVNEKVLKESDDYEY